MQNNRYFKIGEWVKDTMGHVGEIVKMPYTTSYGNFQYGVKMLGFAPLVAFNHNEVIAATDEECLLCILEN